MTKLENKGVIVTGGSSGIGRAAAVQFARAGASVLITGRREDALKDAASGHPGIAYIVSDSSIPEDAGRTVAKAVDAWGRVDVILNNAGAGAILPLADVTAEKVNAIFGVNVTGPSLLSRAALPHLTASMGVIINVSSTFGHKPVAGLSHYAASKAALEHLTRCWALELAPQGIRVNAVAAGPTKSGALTGMMGLTPEQAEAIENEEREQIPLKRRGEPEDVVKWILQLADPESGWVTGQVISVDGGLSVT
ncbi:SDR family NAD(P)-dependent oxidoreductase [Hyphomonas johnsonii]|uniref:3-oxoacyl-(Acyl-carrier-protein) reductase n=1 Tax=Hyphomonas johnsonii MHS-2 TaxID=1280950 RepID=A0A059FUI6_9PROT|nr:SDR family oxidoreductase [Hyphomonas johnsonii]KCZ94088.1 3-oxoacyl-(acyl-carrier-protein) reductase [Hyphomonas johnsonii MHS-2]